MSCQPRRRLSNTQDMYRLGTHRRLLARRGNGPRRAPTAGRIATFETVSKRWIVDVSHLLVSCWDFLCRPTSPETPAADADVSSTSIGNSVTAAWVGEAPAAPVHVPADSVIAMLAASVDWRCAPLVAFKRLFIAPHAHQSRRRALPVDERTAWPVGRCGPSARTDSRAKYASLAAPWPAAFHDPRSNSLVVD